MCIFLYVLLFFNANLNFQLNYRQGFYATTHFIHIVNGNAMNAHPLNHATSSHNILVAIMCMLGYVRHRQEICHRVERIQLHQQWQHI